MIILSIILIPIIAALAAFIISSDTIRRILLISTAIIHLLLTFFIIFKKFLFEDSDKILSNSVWFYFDAPGLLFLLIASVLFLGAAVYAVKYLALETPHLPHNNGDVFIISNTPEAVFTGCLLMFLGAMTAVTASRHFGIIWAAVEATTLFSAPLIYFHRNKHSMEATWKYLLICSVGIALALMGNLFLGASALKSGIPLLIDSLAPNAAGLNVPLLKAAFLFMFVGYGTKMGLAPFHTWLPDAHSEAPALVSALLSGALLNCAFLGILRILQVCNAAHLESFCSDILILFGILSLLTAAMFLLHQKDYKRMLAYSSIEHMGILALGAGLGGNAIYGALLGAAGHSLTKSGLFFVSGIILEFFHTKKIDDIKSLITSTPETGVLWFIGFFLITGTPASAIFLSKFIILKEAVLTGHLMTAIIFIILLIIIFTGLAHNFIKMIYGKPCNEALHIEAVHLKPLFIPPTVFFIIVIMLGVYIPDWLDYLLNTSQALLTTVAI